MNRMLRMVTGLFCATLLAWSAGVAAADEYDTTIERFKESGQAASFFKNSFGYAVFPTVGKGGFIVGGGHGDGRVYRQGRYVGDASVTQLSVGLQAGGQAYSQVIFFEDQRAYEDFTKGTFELGADASAIAIRSGASANAGTTGPAASKSADADDAVTKAKYHKGFAVFTIAKGGAMAQAAVAGQKFSFKPRNAQESLSND